MKFFGLILSFVVYSNTYASGINNRSNIPCANEASDLAKKYEAVKAHIDESSVVTRGVQNVTSSEDGTSPQDGPLIISVFVDSPATADNTHWEFSLDRTTCRLLSDEGAPKRFEAP